MVELGWSKGFIVRTPEHQLIFDPDSASIPAKYSNIFISHAHADHFIGMKSKARKYSTCETRKIFEGVYEKSVVNFNDIKFNQTIDIGNIKVTPLNAGHMLGSTQFLITLPDTSILYTGDINYLDTLTTRRAENVECDILVMEATYGEPSYIFPDRENIYANIVQWALNEINRGSTPVFRSYTAGKAQELVKVFNVYTNLSVLTSDRISRVNKIYLENNIDLVYDKISSEVDSKASVYIISGSNEIYSKQSARAIVTGWAVKMNNRKNAAFPLSSHADFNQLIEFVKDSKAKTVYNFTGFTDIFSNYLRKRLGIKSKPLPQLAQKTLAHFN
ncbi:MBL fold metallo-hydrolase [[Eubacterium] cellulosolvens]